MLEQTPLHYQDGELHLDGVALGLIADQIGTPTYVYSASHIRHQTTALQQAFAGTDTHIHYSVKANSNLAVLGLFVELGVGFDIVSGGELSRVLAAGGDPHQVIFSGVGKSVEEIDFALKLDIQCFNVESASELQRIAERAALAGKVAPIALRVNPNVDAQTHPYISTGLKENKFGVAIEQAPELYRQARANPNLQVTGVDCHIGSQITQAEPLLQALTNILELVDQLAADDIDIQHIDLGGGMGICYQDETPLDFATYGSSVGQILGNRNCAVFLEPGRSLVANAGVLLTRVEYLKPATTPDTPNFAVVDAAMNDLIRPALYQAYHEVVCSTESPGAPAAVWDIVGPVCESGDFLAKQRQLAIDESSLLCLCSAGAYGMVQASNYNSRGRPAEVMVTGNDFALIRRRENINDQLRLELLD